MSKEKTIQKGTGNIIMLGLHSTLARIALLPASVIAGILWDSIGASAPFIYGGAEAAAGVIGAVRRCHDRQLL